MCPICEGLTLEQSQSSIAIEMREEIKKMVIKGMTDDEIAAFLIEEQENQDYSTLTGAMIGIGFLLILISFGARRKKKGGAKRTEKKPAN